MSDAAETEYNVDPEIRDIGDVPSIEVINTVAIHLLSATAVKLGLGEETDPVVDLDEARKLINALALRDGLRTLQLAFREASSFPDAPGKGPGEKWTGPVN